MSSEASSGLRRRVRLRFTRLGKVRFTGARDVARIWERALRKAALTVAYTEGFSPRPKLSFGLALSTGHESLGEYLDVELEAPAGGPAPAVEELPTRLSAALPVGFDVVGAAAVEPGSPSLQQAVVSCTWSIEVVGRSPEQLAPAVERALAADQLVVTRARKGQEVTDDLRPAILALAVTGQTTRGTQLVAELGTQPRGVRPSELLLALGADLEEGRVCRTHQWMLIDGARQEPLPVDDVLAALPPELRAEAPALRDRSPVGATSTPHAWERAS